MNVTFTDGPLIDSDMSVPADSTHIVITLHAPTGTSVLARRDGFYKLQGDSFTWEPKRW